LLCAYDKVSMQRGHKVNTPGPSGGRVDVVDAMQMVKDGYTDLEVADAMPGVWIRHCVGLKRYRRLVRTWRPRWFK
jgi:hypothetical protein